MVQVFALTGQLSASLPKDMEVSVLPPGHNLPVLDLPVHPLAEVLGIKVRSNSACCSFSLLQCRAATERCCPYGRLYGDTDARQQTKIGLHATRRNVMATVPGLYAFSNLGNHPAIPQGTFPHGEHHKATMRRSWACCRLESSPLVSTRPHRASPSVVMRHKIPTAEWMESAWRTGEERHGVDWGGGVAVGMILVC